MRRRGTKDLDVVIPYPRFQHQITDWLELAGRRSTFHALFEADVTLARSRIRAYRARSGDPLSFSAYIIGCVATAIDEDRRIQAVRSGRRELVVFGDVDVAVPVESHLESTSMPVPHIIRAANQKSPPEITEEIRHGRTEPVPYPRARRWLRYWLLVPAPLRRAMLAMFLRDAQRR